MKNLIFIITAIFLLCSTNFAQKYMGVNNPTQNPSCSSSYCHETIYGIWSESAHATAHPVQSESYGYACLQCHTTGWDTATDNFGADEFVSQDINQTPDYIIDPANLADWNARTGVQCEACHGPVGNDDGILDWNHTERETQFTADICGKCHEGSHHPYFSEWQSSGHASGPPVYLDLSERESYSSCMYCHFAQDFVAFLEDPNYDAASFAPQGTLADITCVACHDSHTSNVRDLPEGHEGEAICDVCHTVHEEEIDFNDAPHHTTSEVLSHATNFGWQYEGEDYSVAKSFHSLIRERCTACHMHPTGFNYGTGASAVTGHTFEPRVEACADACHTDYYEVVDTTNHEALFDFRGVQTDIKALWNNLGTLLTEATSEDSTSDRFKKALYNYRAIESEGSWGIHNTKLVEKLLNDAIARMTLTSINEETGTPIEYRLAQNYPNPFNPSTTIKFSIPENSNVKVVIYNSLGMEVAILVDDNLSSGSYQYKWNASSFASGIYLYKLETNNFVDVRKMILIK